MPESQIPAQVSDAILKHAHRVEARANALADEMVEILMAVRDSLLVEITKLQERHLKADDWNNETLARKAAYLTAQREAVDRLLADVYAGMEGAISEAAQDVMTSTIVQTDALMSTAGAVSAGATVGAAAVAPPVGIMAQAGAFSLTKRLLADWIETQTVDGLLINEWLGKMSRASADRIVAAGRESLVMGHGMRKAALHMRARGIEGSIPGLDALARTFIMSASNYARDKRIEEATGELLKGWEYNAVLDGRTCPVCGANDLKFYPKDKPRPSLPRHLKCRCLYLPRLKSWRELGLDLEEMEPAPRNALKHEGHKVHHKDGSTSTRFKVISAEQTHESYNTWLNRQLKEDPAFVRSILGKTRFELFKAGKITLESMAVDGRIKRLSEL